MRTATDARRLIMAGKSKRRLKRYSNTESAENEFYKTRAESHGCIYTSAIRIIEQGSDKSLTMTLDSKPQSFVAMLLSIPMGLLFNGATKKALLQDLNDIKAAVEQH